VLEDGLRAGNWCPIGEYPSGGPHGLSPAFWACGDNGVKPERHINSRLYWSIIKLSFSLGDQLSVKLTKYLFNASYDSVLGP
jgi:hypothetical protein